MLITPDHGPRVRWITVLTDAPLAPTGPGVDAADHCKSCRPCVDVCPPQAFTGARFDPADPLEVRFDRKRCHQYLIERDRAFGFESCGLCIYSCPRAGA